MRPKNLYIFALIFILYIPLSSFASISPKEKLFDGKLYLSNSPLVNQEATITLDLTALLGNYGNTTIVFRMPDGVSILRRSIFTEPYFANNSSYQYSTDIRINKEGVYALEASVYTEISKGISKAEHFFTYLTVTKNDSQITSVVNYLTPSENGIDSNIISLAPARSMATLSIQGHITYYDDNLARAVPIKKVKVQLLEIKQIGASVLGTTYTDNDGFYSFDSTNAPKLADGSTRNIQPKLVFDNEVIKLTDTNSAIYTFEMPLMQGVSVGSFNSDYFINEQNQQRPLGHIFNIANQSYDALWNKLSWKRNKLSLIWPYNAETSNYSYKYVVTNGSVTSEVIRITPKSQWDRTTFFHEYGHSVMMALYGYNRFNIPVSQFEEVHSARTVSDPQFAMNEGWAELFEAMIEDNAYNFPQFLNKNTPNIEYNEWWKGKDGNNTNGEIVEGSIASILWDIVDTAQSNDETPNVDDDNINNMIAELWDVMSRKKPKSISDLWDSWQNGNYGQLESLQSIFVSNGVNVTINPQNQPPVADSKTVEVDEDVALSIKLTGTDPENNPLTYSITEQPKNGTLSGTAHDITYKPNSDYFGTDSFVFIVNDGLLNSVPATVNITVKSINDAPVVVSQNINTQEDTHVAITLSGTDIDSANLTYKVADNPMNGVLEGTEPNLVYKPNKDFNGNDSFTFVINDGFADSQPATISIRINMVNDAPVAEAQSVTMKEDESVNIILKGSDVDNDAITYKIVGQPTNGVLEGTAPNLIYKPNKDFNGNDSFTFVVNDGIIDSQAQKVDIAVMPEQDLPIATAQAVTTDEDTFIKIILSGISPDGDSLSFKIVNMPSNGVLEGNPPEITYKPNADFNGDDYFAFVATNEDVDSAVEKITIKVNPINDIPSAIAQSVNTDENIPVKINLSGNDIDGDKITFKITIEPNNGKITGTPPESVYEPKYGFGGDDSFTFVIEDGTSTSEPTKVEIKVNAMANSFDINRDGFINVLDITIISKYFGKADFPFDNNPDVDRDGKVDKHDFDIVMSNFGKKL